jgi:hypothetical protein
MKEPVDHILRPRLPWRSESPITECGYDASKVKTITRERYESLKKEIGSQRCMMLVCMTCSQTAHRWASWDDDPRKAIGREVEWETSYRASERGERLKDELLAIAALINAHRAEFDQILADADARRQWLAKKAEPAQLKPRTKTHW